MKQYLNLLENILMNGVEKESGRANMPPTIGISHANISMDMEYGFPLLTTKKMFWKGIIHELLWFLRGDTNIKYLVDNKVNVWNKDAYNWYKEFYINLKSCGITPVDFSSRGGETWSLEDFKKAILNNSFSNFPTYGNYTLGDLGKVYGYQWRNQNGVDQVADVINGLKTNPYSRYHIIDGWNKADFNKMALPPCHLLYQFIVRPLTTEERIAYLGNMEADKIVEFPTESLLPEVEENIEKLLDKLKVPKFYLDLNMYQRSCDTFLGVPFNLASMSAMLLIFAKACNMIPGVANWTGGDTHIYVPHLPMVTEQILRKPFGLPQLAILKDLSSLEDILSLTIDDFELQGYESHDGINATLFTGLEEDWGE